VKLPVDLGATSAPPEHHDLGPGSVQSDEDAANAEIAATTNVRDVGPDQAAGSLSGPLAVFDLDESIARARDPGACPVCSGACFVTEPPGYRVPCEACGGTGRRPGPLA
jgi:hypothetical protein